MLRTIPFFRVIAAHGLLLMIAGRATPTEANPPDKPVYQFDVRDYGAMGDGVADDTAAIQSAIDAAGPAGGTVIFPPGTYMVTSVGLLPGVHYLGYGATIKRPPGQGKWVRTFNTTLSGYTYSSDVDSPLMVIEGLTFDGSRTAQEDYDKYQLEQAHLLFISADRSKKGRIRARVLNCNFQECVADAISIYVNADVQIDNCRARNCFRGGIVITGGNTRAQVSNFIAEGDVHATGIDVEVDGSGYGGSYRVDLMFSNLYLPDGDFDIAVRDGSRVLVNQAMTAAPFYLAARGSTVHVSDSIFGVGRYSGYSDRIVFPHNVTFDNCRFMVQDNQSEALLNAEPGEDVQTNEADPGKWAAAHVYWNISGTSYSNQTLRFIDCVFEVDSTIPTQDLTYAIYCEADKSVNSNRLELTGCVIAPQYKYGVLLRQGGNLRLRGGLIQARTALYLGSVGNNGYLIDVLIDSLDVRGVEYYAEIPSYSPLNRILQRGVDIEESDSRILTHYGLAKNRYRGGRRIYGAAAPTPATHGLVGDTFIVESEDGIENWLCTKTGVGSGAVWNKIE